MMNPYAVVVFGNSSELTPALDPDLCARVALVQQTVQVGGFGYPIVVAIGVAWLQVYHIAHERLYWSRRQLQVIEGLPYDNQAPWGAEKSIRRCVPL
jgi:hypothetical protein